MPECFVSSNALETEAGGAVRRFVPFPVGFGFRMFDVATGTPDGLSDSEVLLEQSLAHISGAMSNAPRSS